MGRGDLEVTRIPGFLENESLATDSVWNSTSRWITIKNDVFEIFERIAAFGGSRGPKLSSKQVFTAFSTSSFIGFWYLAGRWGTMTNGGVPTVNLIEPLEG